MSVELHPLAAIGDPSAPPLVGFLAGSNRPYLLFATGTLQRCVWTFRVPSVTSPVVQLQWSIDAGAPSGSVDWRVEVMAVTPDASENVHADSYDTANNQTGTFVGSDISHLNETTVSLSNFDGAAAGDYMALRLSRVGTGTINQGVRLHAATLELG